MPTVFHGSVKIELELIDGGRESITEPSYCPSCGSETTRLLRGSPGAVTYCTNPKNCKDALIAKIKNWIGGSKRGVGILGIGDTMVEALWRDNLIRDQADLYKLTVDSIKNIELDGVKIGASRATTIVDNIEKSKNLDVHTFLGSLGIELLGRRRVQQFQDSAKGKLDSLDNWLDLDNLRSLSFPGYGAVIKETIIAGISDNLELILKLCDNGVTVASREPVVVNDDLPFSGLSFCLTGTRDHQDDIRKLGGEIKSSVSKNLTYLVQKDPLSSSGKTKKAESYGTKIISIDYLVKAINGEVNLRDNIADQIDAVPNAPKEKASPAKQPVKVEAADVDDFVSSMFGD